MSRSILEGKSSAFLYIYQYLFLIAVSYGLAYINTMLSILPLLGIMALFIDAKTMKYKLTKDVICLSGSLLDKGSNTVQLKDIVSLYVIDNPPWSWLAYGTVVLITDFDEDMQPCIKCVRNPYDLARKIESYAVNAGASFNE